MDKETLIKGCIMGMESLGAVLTKNTDTHLYFDLPKTFTREMLERAQEGLFSATGLRIKYKYDKDKRIENINERQRLQNSN